MTPAGMPQGPGLGWGLVEEGGRGGDLREERRDAPGAWAVVGLGQSRQCLGLGSLGGTEERGRGPTGHAGSWEDCPGFVTPARPGPALNDPRLRELAPPPDLGQREGEDRG